MDKMPWWTDKNIKFAQECANFCDEELIPEAMRLQETPGLNAMDIQWKASKLCIEKGFHPLLVLTEEKYGGTEQGYTGYTILNEEIGRSQVNINPLLTSVFGSGPLLLFGTDAQKEKFMKPLLKGDKWASITVTEPDVGNDAAGIQCRAELDGDEWVLNGWKRFITLAAIGDYLMVYANSDPGARRIYRHLSAFFIPRNTPGITIEKINELNGDVEMANSVIRFKDVRVPKENMILDPGDGWTVMTSALNIERLGIAGVVGSSINILETCRAYGRRRVQFSQPISRFEGIQLRMANISINMNLSRVYLYYLADLLDKGKADMFSFGVKSAVCKVFSTEALTQICLEANHIVAGDGYTKEFGIGTVLENAVLMRIAGGSNDILRIFIGRNEFMRDIEERHLPRVLRGVTKEEADKL